MRTQFRCRKPPEMYFLLDWIVGRSSSDFTRVALIQTIIAADFAEKHPKIIIILFFHQHATCRKRIIE